MAPVNNAVAAADKHTTVSESELRSTAKSRSVAILGATWKHVLNDHLAG